MLQRVWSVISNNRQRLLPLGFIAIFAASGVIYLLFSQAAETVVLGDVNKDGVINKSDADMVIGAYGTTSAAADVNRNGIVDILDLSNIYGNFGKRTTPTTPVSHYDPNKPYTIIMIGWHNYEAQYAQLENSRVNLTYRSIEKTPESNARDLTLWDSTGYKYYNNVAGSDWASATGNACTNIPHAYMDQSYANQLVQRSGSLGYYIHEMVSLNAACNGWQWTTAADTLNWALFDQYVSYARAQGKKIIWSEPAQGWDGILASAAGQAFLGRSRDVIIPMFATNFNTAAYNWVPTARAGALRAAQTYETPLGESVQSWYFRESPDPLTIDSTINLAEFGYQVGSKYYQIEGTWGDMQWPAGKPTTYMQGILQFSKRLESR